MADNSSGAQKIADERDRVIAEEGYTLSHDREHYPEDLLECALAYLLGPGTHLVTVSPENYPFGPDAFKFIDGNGNFVERNLVKAGQFVAALIDRISPPHTYEKQL